MHTLQFSHSHSNHTREQLNLEPDITRAVLTTPRTTDTGHTYNHIVWVGEIKRSDNISGDIKRLNRFCKRDNPSIKSEVSIPVAWI